MKSACYYECYEFRKSETWTFVLTLSSPGEGGLEVRCHGVGPHLPLAVHCYRSVGNDCHNLPGAHALQYPGPSLSTPETQKCFIHSPQKGFSLTLMPLVANLIKTKRCTNRKNKWLKPSHVVLIWVLSQSSLMSTNMTGFRLFLKVLASLCFERK